jgi:DNA repair protein RadC
MDDSPQGALRPIIALVPDVAYPTPATPSAEYALPPIFAGGLAEEPAAGAFDRFLRAQAHRPEHWSRWRQLRRRFLEGGPDALSDRETLEILLTLSGPVPEPSACLADRLINRFGSLAGVMGASPSAIAKLSPDSRRARYRAICVIKAVQVASVRMARSELVGRPIIGSCAAVVDYCRKRMAHLREEALRVLFLNRKNMLILEEEMHRGTVDNVPLYPREIVRRSLEIGASAIVLIHNHPSGDPTPSRVDIDLTTRVASALKLVDIGLHDHIIIGDAGYASFRALGLL